MNILKAGGLLALLLGAGAAAASAPRHDGAHGVDAPLRRALNNVRAERLESALVEVDELIARYPNFRLAHLVRGDLLLARTRPITTFGKYGNEDSDPTRQGQGAAHVVKTPAIPLAWPTYVAVSDRYAYVADTVNRRVLRARLTYAATAVAALP